MACYLDQGHVDKAEAYLPASYLTQMPSYLVTEFKGIFKKHGEREKKENQWASGVQFIHICSKWHRDKQKRVLVHFLMISLSPDKNWKIVQMLLER